jgi:SAM-dependent methyltransferase
MDRMEADHWWFAGRRSIIETTIRRLIPLSDEATILEAGCGTGGNLRLLQSIGELHAFEFDEEARRRAESKSNIRIPFGALPAEVPDQGQNYDLIALFDVLEHVEEDSASLKALSVKLRDGGRILLTVPAYPWLWSRHDERHHHFRRYSKTTVSKAAREAGLRVEHAFYFNTFLFPVAVGLRALKMTFRRDTPDDEMPGPLMNALLRWLFTRERYLIGRVPMPVGLSVCAVLSKDANGCCDC